MIPVISILLAFALPVFVLWQTNRGKMPKHPYLFSAGSFACCAWGMIAEILGIKQRLLAGDIGGIQDTIDAVVMICVILLVVTLVLNLLLLGLTYEEQREQVGQVE